MCDGTYYFNRKGRKPVRPTKPYTLVICSNKAPTELYGERQEGNKTYASRMPLFNARFRTIDPSSELNIGNPQLILAATDS